jgi:hypothetical protein
MYRGLVLQIGGGLTPQYISEIRIKPNGLPIQTFSWNDFQSMLLFKNQPTDGPDTNNVYRLFISQERLSLIGGDSYVNFKDNNFMSGSAGDAMDATLLNCGSLDAAGKQINIQKVEVDVNNWTGGATAFMNILAEASPSFPGGAGILKTITKSFITIANGQNMITKNNFLPIGDKMHTILDTIYLFPPDDGLGNTAILDNFQVNFNGNYIRQRNDTDNRFLQSRYRVPQPNVYAFDFTENGRGDQSLPTGDPTADIWIKFDASNPAGTTPLPGVLRGYMESAGFLF